MREPPAKLGPHWPPPILLPLLLLLLLPLRMHAQEVTAVSCEPGTVPVQVNVHPDGRPELVCRWPDCSLLPPEASEAEPVGADSSSRGQKRRPKTAAADGREADEEAGSSSESEEFPLEFHRRAKRRTPDPTELAAKVRCAETLSDMVCDLPDEWTAALTEVNNGTHISLFMQCCLVEHLSEWAAPLKRVLLSAGEHFAGGPVLHNGQMVAFDLVKEVRKNVTDQNEVQYVLSVSRALCSVPVPVAMGSSASSAAVHAPSTFSRLYGSRAAAGPNAQRALQQGTRRTLPYAKGNKERRRHPSTTRRGDSSPAAEGEQQLAQGQHPQEQERQLQQQQRSTQVPTAQTSEEAAAAAPGETAFVTATTQQSTLRNTNNAQSTQRTQPPPQPPGLGRQRANSAAAQGTRTKHRHYAGIRRRMHRPPVYARRAFPPLLVEEAEAAGLDPYYYEDGEAVAPFWLDKRRTKRPPWRQMRRIRTEGTTMAALTTAGRRRPNFRRRQPSVAESRDFSGANDRRLWPSTPALSLSSASTRSGANSRSGTTPRPTADTNSNGNRRLSRYGPSREAAILGAGKKGAGARLYAPSNAYSANVQVPVKRMSSTSEEESALQSVVEQQAAEEAEDAEAASLADELAAAMSQLEVPPAPAGDENYVTLIPQREQQQLHLPPPPKPISHSDPTVNSYIEPPNSLVGCSGGCGGMRLGGGCGGGGGGCSAGGGPVAEIKVKHEKPTEPRQIGVFQLACGSCSCSQCQCSSLPPPCSGPACPTCPSVCSCPSECGCGGPSLAEIEAAANAAEQAANQAEQQSYGQGQQQQYYYSGTGMNAAFASLQCFSGDQLVRTPRGQVRMDALRVGDLVLSVEESLVAFSPVVMFLHRKPTERASFRLVRTQMGHRLQLTDLHLIWTGCTRLRLVHANQLRVGDCLYAMLLVQEERHAQNDTALPQTNSASSSSRMVASRIESIEQVEQTGIYAPLTSNGNILVNGVLASCHSNMAAQTLQQTFFNWWRQVRRHWTAVWRALDWWWWPHTEEGERKRAQPEEQEVPTGVRFVLSVLDTLLPNALLSHHVD